MIFSTLYEQQKDEIQAIKAKNTMLEKELQGLEKETKTLAVQHEEIKSQQIPLVEQLVILIVEKVTAFTYPYKTYSIHLKKQLASEEKY